MLNENGIGFLGMSCRAVIKGSNAITNRVGGCGPMDRGSENEVRMGWGLGSDDRDRTELRVLTIRKMIRRRNSY
eukprot:1178182-Prorocentrum_minimum.AAC.3